MDVWLFMHYSRHGHMDPLMLRGSSNPQITDGSSMGYPLVARGQETRDYPSVWLPTSGINLSTFRPSSFEASLFRFSFQLHFQFQVAETSVFVCYGISEFVHCFLGDGRADNCQELYLSMVCVDIPAMS